MCGGKFKPVSIAHGLSPRLRRTVLELYEKTKKEQKNSGVDEENFKFVVVGAHNKPRVINIQQQWIIARKSLTETKH